MRVLVCAFFAVLPVARVGARPKFQTQAAMAQSNAVVFIAHMYEQYSWETRDAEFRGKTPLFAAPPAVLQRFFAAPLVKAILADRECAARTRGECHLSFEPMWDSQDPGGVAVQVIPTRDPMVVQARLHYPYQNETRVVAYRMRNTTAGLRIVDMSARQWPSLMKLLQQPVR